MPEFGAGVQRQIPLKPVLSDSGVRINYHVAVKMSQFLRATVKMKHSIKSITYQLSNTLLLVRL